MHSCNPIVLDHLDRMSDATGLVQHAIYSIPRRDSGYTTDDNARALRLCARLCSEEPQRSMLDRVTTYLGFMQFAQCADGGFHNFLSYQRTGWMPEVAMTARDSRCVPWPRCWAATCRRIIVGWPGS